MTRHSVLDDCPSQVSDCGGRPGPSPGRPPQPKCYRRARRLRPSRLRLVRARPDPSSTSASVVMPLALLPVLASEPGLGCGVAPPLSGVAPPPEPEPEPEPDPEPGPPPLTGAASIRTDTASDVAAAWSASPG